MTEVVVSDHAVLRYLERVHGVDVAAVRKAIKREAARAAKLGATGVRIEGVSYKLAYQPGYAVVVTVIRGLALPASRDGSSS